MSVSSVPLRNLEEPVEKVGEGQIRHFTTTTKTCLFNKVREPGFREIHVRIAGEPVESVRHLDCHSRDGAIVIGLTHFDSPSKICSKSRRVLKCKETL